MQGVPLAEIARRLGVAESTVGYHARRLRDPQQCARQPKASRGAPTGGATAHQASTRLRLRDLLEAGLSRGEVARRLGLSKSTVSYHARRLGEPVDERGARRYDWSTVQRYYDAGHSVRECQRRFGFSRQTWSAAVKRGAVVARPHGMPITELCVAGVPRARHNIKGRLIRSGLKTPACEGCGISTWLGQPLGLALHHVNGDRHDNRLENLQLLCPNCHSQTGNYGGRRAV